MRETILDAATWNTADDVYESFLRAIGAPAWHGKNLDALSDNIAGGDINQVEVPCRITICNFDRVGTGVKKMADNFIDLIHDLASGGTPVEVVVRGTS